MDTEFDDSGAMYVNTGERTVYKLLPESTHYAITFTKPAVIEITDKDKNVHKYDVIELLDGLFELIKQTKGNNNE